MAGGTWFDREAASQARDRAAARTGALTLTRRERDVARLVASGKRNRDIANELGISEGTVKMHLHNAYAKLGLESRTQLAMDERLRA
jgi:two-component system nitrate/nitrite response regulator NarP